ncbi:HD domain-containing phosphohydrolase [Candidatus Magnetaquicoccus inordinatus]|uniref:HD domain-containing phosphohydrolase n=1 Tax=Candidatus Magnetaquicoccus inordinatus TaxID=2496818 RepID=UPI00102B139C|nr:HD domain-containing phosphohydrolase [Candidatus Magnetaquicoccus inordinatus]
MLDYDTFQPEQTVIDQAEMLLAKKEEGQDYSAAFAHLLEDYKRLFKVSRRLVRMSDRSDEVLKLANEKIKTQQAELEKAHYKLALHAETLEERVKERTKELVTSQGRLHRLVGLGIALSMERNQARFMEMILQGAKELATADGGILLVRTAEEQLCPEILSVDTLELRFNRATDDEVSEPPLPMRDPQSGLPNYFNPMVHAALTKRTVQIDNCYESTEYQFTELHRFDREHQYRSVSLLAVPLKPRQGEVIGVLVLINARKPQSGRVISFSEEVIGFVEALAAQAAVAMENKNLAEAQERLLESIIQLTATAIDYKSPYTGGHCERVPEICMGLAQAACAAEEGPFADFEMSNEEWRAFRLAAWMHDCGKMTTPEYVVDKATKLETIYNRIHEIRTRFEVLRRDRLIACLEGIIHNPAEEESLRRRFQEECRQLEDDFAFVAECNVGGEFMAPERLVRLEQIAQLRWTRHFNDRLGLSHAELQRLAKIAVTPLPAQEHLLCDKPEQVIPRNDKQVSKDLLVYGITLAPPKHLYNLGEIYNLRIARGTLTDEERFKVNEHVIQTIIMLEQLPFPPHLSRVPEFAGCHHETMDGKGYPRQLHKKDMSIPARILAIADIFEALTAADRPYKKPKTLSEALRIMSFMRDSQHLDAELFDLFLSSGVWREYAERFLMPKQLDTDDISRYLSEFD